MNAQCQKIAITISPPPRKAYKKCPDPYKYFFLEDRLVINLAFKYNRINKYIIYPELDPKGRLHYHGIVELDHNQRVRFYKHAIHKLGLLGFVDVKPLIDFKNELRWIVYMSKDWGFTSSLLEETCPILKPMATKGKVMKNPFAEKEVRNTIDNYFDYLIDVSVIQKKMNDLDYGLDLNSR